MASAGRHGRRRQAGVSRRRGVRSRRLAAGVVAAVLSIGWACAAAPDPAQQAVVEAFVPLAVQSKVVYDDKGNVVRLAISNHTAFWKDKTKPAPGGLNDELFRRILAFTELEAVAIEKQEISDASYALLGHLKKLRDVRLHYMSAEAGASKDAPLFINELPLPLEVLELKHNFRIKGGCMGKLKAQPELRKLEIDTGYADGSAVGFIKQSPKISNLQIHRTTMSDAELQEVFAALPDLEILLVRPTGQKGEGRITGRSLRGLKDCRKLRLIILGLQWGELPYDGGLGVLATLPKLEKLVLAPNDIKGFSTEDGAVQKLHKARPDIEIRVGRESLGGVEGRTTEQEDADWNWDGGVTTHG